MEELYRARQTAKDFLVNLCSRINGIVDLYQSGEYTKANERMVFFTEDISVLSEGLNALEEAGFNVSIDELNIKLNNILEQFENEDYLFVSDLLKYELMPLLEQWQEEIAYDQ